MPPPFGVSLAEYVPSLDQSYRYDDDGKDEQQVNESAEGVGAHHPERP